MVQQPLNGTAGPGKAVKPTGEVERKQEGGQQEATKASATGTGGGQADGEKGSKESTSVWILLIDGRSREPYFFDSVTGATTWERPASLSADAVAAAVASVYAGGGGVPPQPSPAAGPYGGQPRPGPPFHQQGPRPGFPPHHHQGQNTWQQQQQQQQHHHHHHHFRPPHQQQQGQFPRGVPPSAATGTAPVPAAVGKLDSVLSKVDNSGAAAAAAAGVSGGGAWVRYFDPQGKPYYSQGRGPTAKTQWNKPDDFVEPLQTLLAPPRQGPVVPTYAQSATFNKRTGRFDSADGSSHWDRVGRPKEREERQMAMYFDPATLDKNREKAEQEKNKRRGNA